MGENTPNYFDTLQEAFSEYIKNIKEDEVSIKPLFDSSLNHQLSINRLEILKEKIIELKNQDPADIMTVEKLKAIKKLFKAGKTEKPITIANELIPMPEALNVLVFNVYNLELLTENEKKLFARLLLMNDLEELDKLCKDKNLINTSVKNINIKNVIETVGASDATQEHDTLSFVLKSMFPELKHDFEYSQFLQDIFKGLPKSEVLDKYKINLINFKNKYYPDAIINIHSLSYQDSPPQLKRQSILSRIQLKEYEHTLKAPLDYSDFIILTYGLLHNLSKEGMNDYLLKKFSKIEKKYLELDYEACEKDLLKVAKKLNVDQKLVELMSSKPYTEVNKDRNYSRRFYEARVGQYAMGQFDDPEKLKSFNKIFNFLGLDKVSTSTEAEESLTLFTNIIESTYPEYEEGEKILKTKSPKYKIKDRTVREGFVPKEKENLGELEPSYEICLMAALVDDDLDNAILGKIYLSSDGTYIVRDPLGKEVHMASLPFELPSDFEDHLNDPEFVESVLKVTSSRKQTSGMSTYSMNLGGMTANAPNFPDLIAKAPIRNRLSDIMKGTEWMFVQDEDDELKFELKSSYSSTDKRNRSAYVASLSGHIFALIAVCEAYVAAQNAKFKDKVPAAELKETLSQDINHFLSAYITLYAAKGYHSLLEVLDVIREPELVEYFKNELQVDLNPQIDEKVLSLTMNDTLAYSKGLAFKGAMHTELVAKHPPKETPQKPITFSNEQKREAARQKREKLMKAEKQAAADKEVLLKAMAKQREKIENPHPKK